jgi:DNA-binding HxlR family transcriptional regulator
MAPSAKDEVHVCPMAGLLETLARPWTLQILWVLSTNGPTRFGALRRGVPGISSRVLTERLRALEEKRFIYRDYKPAIPPEVTYGIAERMRDVQKVLAELDELARKWKTETAPEERGIVGRGSDSEPTAARAVRRR